GRWLEPPLDSQLPRQSLDNFLFLHREFVIERSIPLFEKEYRSNVTVVETLSVLHECILLLAGRLLLIEDHPPLFRHVSLSSIHEILLFRQNGPQYSYPWLQCTYRLHQSYTQCIVHSCFLLFSSHW